MHKSKNKSTITRRIMSVGRKMSVFRCIDLIHAYFGKHQSDDWQERLDSLVSEGRLHAKEMLVGDAKTWTATHYSLKPF